MADKLKDIVIDVVVSDKSNNSLKQLKDEIKEATAEVIRLRSQEVLDDEAIVKATKRAGELRDQFSAANEAIRTMTAGDDFEKLGNSVGLLSGQVSSLDFGGAAESAKQFTQTLKGVNPAKMKDDFLAFAGSVAGLSKQFVKMGITLLANPIFLIVAVVGAIVIAIVLLKDKLVIVEKAFDILMVPIKALIQGLKDLTDWMGLTSFASDELADKQIANSQRILDANKKSNDLLAASYSRKMAIMKANGEDTTNFEIQEAKRVTDVSEIAFKETAKQIDKLISKQKDKTTKEREEIQKQIDDKRTQYEQEKQIYLNSANNIQVLIDTDSTKKRDEAIKNENKSAADREKAIAANKAARAKADADAIEALKIRYDVERSIIQASIYSMEDGLSKELAINEEKLRVLEQDLQFTKFNEEQKRQLRLVYQKNRESDDLKAFKKLREERVKEAEQTKKDLIAFNADLNSINKSYNGYLTKTIGTEGDKRILAINDERDLQLSNLQKGYEMQIAANKGNYAKLEQLRKEHEARMNSIITISETMRKESDDESKNEEIQKVVDKYNEISEVVSGFTSQISDIINSGLQNRIDAVEDEKDRSINNLSEQQTAELSIVGLTEEQKNAINDKYAKKKYQVELKAFNEGEKLKKKQFEADKAFRMVGVVMDTASGIMNAVGKYGFPAAIPLVAATAAIGIAQLAVISQQKYKGASGPSAPSGSSSTGGGGVSEPTKPDLKLTGKQSDDNTITSNENNDKLQPIIVKAYVSETEMTETQDKIAKIKSSGEL